MGVVLGIFGVSCAVGLVIGAGIGVGMWAGY